MVDRKAENSNRGIPDSTFKDAYSVRDWAEKYGVTGEQLKAAVYAVGIRDEDIEIYNGKSRRG